MAVKIWPICERVVYSLMAESFNLDAGIRYDVSLVPETTLIFPSRAESVLKHLWNFGDRLAPVAHGLCCDVCHPALVASLPDPAGGVGHGRGAVPPEDLDVAEPEDEVPSAALST